MRELCVQQAWPRGNGLTMPPQPWPLAILSATALFIPALFIGRVTWAGSAREYNEDRSFWRDWHAKYDRYSTRDGKHNLNNASLPSEWPRARANVTCLCGATVENAPSDEAALAAFQKHLDKHEPERIDLGERHG